MHGMEFVSYLLAEDRRDTVDEQKRTLLHLACQENMSERQVEALLLYGVNVNARDASGRTALHYACTASNITYCKLLKEHGADMNVLDNASQSLLHASAQSEKSDDEIVAVCTFLFSHDVKRTKDKDGHFPIYYTFKDPVAELFVQRGASYDDMQCDLFRAVEAGSLRLCKETLARGFSITRDEEKRTPLHHIVLSDLPIQKCIDICGELLRVIDIEARDNNMCTALALCTRDKIADFLIQQGAREENFVLPPDARILQRAVRYLSKNIMTRWLEHNFDANTSIDGSTMVHTLIQSLGRQNQNSIRGMLNILRQHGANLNMHGPLLEQKLRQIRTKRPYPYIKQHQTLPLRHYFTVPVRLTF